MKFQSTLEFAREMDRQDPLAPFRERFHLPKKKDGSPALYFLGNSLGLQPKSAGDAIEEEMRKWAEFIKLG